MSLQDDRFPSSDAFDTLQSYLEEHGKSRKEFIESCDAIFEFVLTNGKKSQSWYLDLKSTGEVGRGSAPDGKKPDVNIKLTDADFSKLHDGLTDPEEAIAAGKIKVKGDTESAEKLIQVLFRTHTIEQPGPGKHSLVFYSRPDLSPPKLQVNYIEEKHVTPGYLFISLWRRQPLETGPYIFTSRGELVWDGSSRQGVGNAHGFIKCDFDGQPHLCFFEGNQLGSHATGRGRIINDHYEAVTGIVSGGGHTSMDMHEFNVLPGGETALMSCYEPKMWDLTDYDLPDGYGWIFEGSFQEVDTKTNEVLFNWHSLDHVSLDENPRGRERYGLSKINAWDYMHINSVDKNADGDYLISGRHTSTIYKISAKDGSILWRLGGSRSDFKTSNFELGYQHHARFLEDNDKATRISVFNNGGDTHMLDVKPLSYALIIEIDHKTKVAEPLHRYMPKADEFFSPTQGSIDIDPKTKNALVNWGVKPQVTEYLENGTMIYNVTLTSTSSSAYRAHKAKWEGHPSTIPAIWNFAQYAKESNAPLVAYASWNGATEVASWRVWAGQNRDKRESFKADKKKKKKTGFETRIVTGFSYQPFAFVEALDQEGKSLANSSIEATFVPSKKLAKHCSKYECPLANVKELDLDKDKDEIAHSHKEATDRFNKAKEKHKGSSSGSGSNTSSFGSFANKWVLCFVLLALAAIVGTILVRWRKRRRTKVMESDAFDLDYVDEDDSDDEEETESFAKK